MADTTFNARFDRQYRVKILAGSLDRQWMRTHPNLFVPELFETKEETQLAKLIHNHWIKYGQVPDETELIQAARAYNDDDREQVLALVTDVFDEADACDWQFAAVQDRYAEWMAYYQTLALIMDTIGEMDDPSLDVLALVNDLKQGLDDVVATCTGSGSSDDIMVTSEEPLKAENLPERIPTGIEALDRAAKGGLARGELGVVMAPPNRGKSMFLMNMGYNASKHPYNFNVLHMLLCDMSAHDLYMRYGNRLTFGMEVDLQDPESLAVYAQERGRRARTTWTRGNVYITRMSNPTIVQICAKIDAVKAEGFEPDMVIVDYGDQMSPMVRRQSHWIEQNEKFDALKGAAIDYDMAFWTGSQAGRQAINKETVGMEDTAEGFGKMHSPDIVVTPNQTIDERKLDKGRLFIAKMRNGPSRYAVPIKWDEAMQYTGDVKGAIR